MRLSWRFLRLRARDGPWTRVSVQHSHLELQSRPNLGSLRSLTSLLHGKICPSQPIFSSHFADSVNRRNHTFHRFSSEPELKVKDSYHSFISYILAEPRSSEEIRRDLEANNVVISHDWVLGVLEKLESSPDVARRFFDWVSESEKKRLSSKSYNLMLGILGLNGFVNEFWGLFEVMKKRGYGISSGVRDRVLENFQKEGSIGDVKKLKHVFDSGSIDNSEEKIALRAFRIIRNDVWSDDVEKQLRDLNVSFTSDVVRLVLESLGTDPTKALIFFRWLEESGLFKHDQRTYNALAKMLGREDSADRFWKVVDEMKSSEFEMDASTFAIVLGRFCKRRMMEDAVNLYEFAMAGPNNKPLADCGTFLLKKIAVAAKLDIGLFSRVLKSFTGDGHALTDSMLDAVLKSLKSVGRVEQSAKVLNAMDECGYVASSDMQSKIVFLLCSARKRNEAIKFVNNMEVSGHKPDWKVWNSLIQGLCSVGDLEKASDCIRKMIESEGVDSAGSPLHSIVVAYCRRNKALDAYKLLHNLASEKDVKPRHTTYQVLITNLLAQGGFSDAVNILRLMKDHEFPPFVDPFVEYVSKSGTGDEAIAFLKATSKRVSSTSLFLRVFEAYFKVGRRSEAQNFLSKCPSSIRNHADVLHLFASAKSGKVAATTPLAS